MTTRNSDPEYRESARELMATTGLTFDIGHFAHVHKCAGGAFVEVALWVPDSARHAQPERKPVGAVHGD